MNEKVSLFVGDLTVGGAERVAVNLSKGFCQMGWDVDIVLCNKIGSMLSDVPKDADIVELPFGRLRWNVYPLRRYINSERPRALVSFMTGANVVAIIANSMVKNHTEVICTEHTVQSLNKNPKTDIELLIARFLYKSTENIVGVSSGVVEDVLNWSKVPDRSVHKIYNPTIDKKSLNKQYELPANQWFSDSDKRILISAGRFQEEKDYSTLIKSFSKIYDDEGLYLVILGDGELRDEYEYLIQQHSIEDRVLLPGFVDDPMRYFYHSDVFVLSSILEGLSLVLIEAMACGTPVVSTDCPHGPREVLDHGEYGPLVPVGDPDQLAEGIMQALNSPVSSEKLKNRAMDFTIEKATSKYISLIESND